jgi:hypothetical protein
MKLLLFFTLKGIRQYPGDIPSWKIPLSACADVAAAIVTKALTSRLSLHPETHPVTRQTLGSSDFKSVNTLNFLLFVF